MNDITQQLAEALRTARGTLNWYAVENNDDGDREQVEAIDVLLAEYDAQHQHDHYADHEGRLIMFNADTPKPVDVLQRYADYCANRCNADIERGRPSMAEYWRGEKIEANAALAAVAELIEADRSYDRAKEQLRQIREAWAPDEVDSMAPAVLRFKEAEARRCAALARVQGGAK